MGHPHEMSLSLADAEKDLGLKVTDLKVIPLSLRVAGQCRHCRSMSALSLQSFPMVAHSVQADCCS